MPSMFRVKTSLVGGPGGDQLTTMFFRDDGVLTAQHAADAVRLFWNQVQPDISSAYTAHILSEVDRVDVATGQPTDAVNTTTLPVVMGDAGDPLPWQTQGLVEYTTGIYLAGRQVRGKTFIPGPTETRNTAGVPVASYITDGNSAISTLVGDVLSDFGVYSRKHRAFVTVTGGSTWPKWSVLRSRRD